LFVNVPNNEDTNENKIQFTLSVDSR